MSKIDEQNLKYDFNIANSYDFYGQLLANKNKTLKTWAVKWYASAFLHNGLSLHPFPSLVVNIGHDGMGENCVRSNNFEKEKLSSANPIKKIDLKENKEALEAMIAFHHKISWQPKKSKTQLLKSSTLNKAKQFKLILMKIFKTLYGNFLF